MNSKEKYEKLRDIILEWNEKINVTAIRDPEDFMKKNVEDSLLLAGTPEYEKAETVLDMGTGGGFPGLPLAINSPDKQFVLTDAIGKKLKVVQAAADELGLINVTVIHSRAEDLAKKKEHREQYDAVVSRAVANMSTLSEYCLPFVKQGGHFIAYKTWDSMEEIEAASNAIKVLGGEIVRMDKCGEEGNGHMFVIVKKIKTTPSKYPRKAGLPSKEPIV